MVKYSLERDPAFGSGLFYSRHYDSKRGRVRLSASSSNYRPVRPSVGQSVSPSVFRSFRPSVDYPSFTVISLSPDYHFPKITISPTTITSTTTTAPKNTNTLTTSSTKPYLRSYTPNFATTTTSTTTTTTTISTPVVAVTMVIKATSNHRDFK